MNITLRQFLDNYKNGKYDSDDVQTQCDAGWYDWFCRDTSLQRKTAALTRRLKSIVKSGKINIDTMYVCFKNNCPCDGKLFDDFRICDMKTGNVIYTVVPKSGYRRTEGRSEVYGRENKFAEPLAGGTWDDVQRFFEVTVTPKTKTKRKPKAKLLGADSNIFNLLGIASKALRENRLHDQVTEMTNRVHQAKSFDEALATIMEYIDAC